MVKKLKWNLILMSLLYVGLGIFLVRELADECSYLRHDDMNEFRACFALPKDAPT